MYKILGQLVEWFGRYSFAKVWQDLVPHTLCQCPSRLLYTLLVLHNVKDFRDHCHVPALVFPNILEWSIMFHFRQKGWNGHESHEKTQWTFAGSLFYSIICITTIGYGDQTPKTTAGKCVTIVYAIVGMPLMLFCLSNTGHAMAQSFR